MRFHQVYTNGAEHVSEIMAWEPSKKIVWHNYEGDAKTPVMIISYYFEEEGPYTHVLHTVECDEYENQAKPPRRHAQKYPRARESEENSGGRRVRRGVSTR